MLLKKNFDGLIGIAVAFLIVLVLSAVEPDRSAWAAAAEAAIPGWSSQCSAATSIDLAALQDAPTQITRASPQDAINGVPAYCEIQGYVSPQMGLLIRLP